MDIKWHIPSPCLDASRMWFSTGISSINRTFKCLWLKTRQTPQNGHNVHRFQVRTPICHIVPVSRAHRGGVYNFTLDSESPDSRFRIADRCQDIWAFLCQDIGRAWWGKLLGPDALGDLDGLAIHNANWGDSGESIRRKTPNFHRAIPAGPTPLAPIRPRTPPRRPDLDPIWT